MPLDIICSCGKQYRVPDEWAGKKLRCKLCGKSFIAEATELPESAPSAAAMGAYARAPSLTAVAQRMHAARQPAQGAEPRTMRDYAYLLFLVALLPLAFMFLFDTGDAGARLDKSLDTAPPPLQQVVTALKEELEISGPLPDWVFPHLPRAFYQALPGDRVPGAFLSRDSWGHWGLAIVFAGGYLGLICLLFPRGVIRARQLLITGLFTATGGILLLMGLQLLARATRGWVMVRGGIVALIFWALKLIGGAYELALDPSTNFFLSAFGFTASVGLLEEGVKALPIIYLIRREDRVGWRSLCVIGLASGAGFGIAEGIRYSSAYYNGIDTFTIYLVRFASCVALHAVWSGSAGIFAAQQQRRIQEATGLGGFASAIFGVTVVSVILHGLYDTLLKKQHEGMAIVLAAITIGVLAAQIEFMRKKEQTQLAAFGAR